MVGVEISKWFSSFCVWRVSSHAMRSTLFQHPQRAQRDVFKIANGRSDQVKPGLMGADVRQRLFLALATQFSALCQQAHGVHQVLQGHDADNAFAFGHRHQGESTPGKAADGRA